MEIICEYILCVLVIGLYAVFTSVLKAFEVSKTSDTIQIANLLFYIELVCRLSID